MHIRNVRIPQADGSFRRGDIRIADGRISDRSADGPEIDGGGLIAIPGLVDIHLHGAAGCDFSDADPAALQRIAEYEAAHGVLAFCPAAMTLPEDRLTAILSAAASFSQGAGADLIGARLEGPFLNPERAGAQDPSCVCRGDASMLDRLIRAAGGLLRLVDLAPEYQENMDLISRYHDRMIFSIGHTCCSYDCACAAFQAGADHLTHCFDAMPGLSHRAPGPIAAAADEGAFAELIADGIHVHPAMVRLAFRLFGPDHIVLISDSMRACGLPDGLSELGGQQVFKQGSRAVLARDPAVIAGSVTNLFDCMRWAVQAANIPLFQAVRAASWNPAVSMGIQRDYGSLAPGSWGNVLLCGDDLKLCSMVQKGKLCDCACAFPASDL